MAEEHDFAKDADAFMRDLMRTLSEFDPDEVEADLAMDVISMQFADRTKAILNRQAAASQIWLACGATAWHFAKDSGTGEWLDTKGRGELRAVLAGVIGGKLGRRVTL
jgi:CyaY protein